MATSSSQATETGIYAMGEIFGANSGKNQASQHKKQSSVGGNDLSSSVESMLHEA